MGGSDGGDLVFGLATMAAVQYPSSSSALMRLFCRGEKERRGHEEVKREKRERVPIHPSHRTQH